MSNETSERFQANQNAIEWTQAHRNGGSASDQLKSMHIEPRTPLVGDWLKAGDLGFIFAGRGIGKTWLSMYLAKGLAVKADVGPWKTHRSAKVLYLDGEMPPEDLRDRDTVLGPPTNQLVYVNHEILFQRTGKVMNLADLSFQEGTLNYCLQDGFNVLFADNLSTLSFGIDENKSLDWEMILPWLLTLRRNHITVIFIHHAGRSGQMRGSSKREDPAFWIIRLDEDTSRDESAHGATFVSRFTKWRNASALPLSYRWRFRPVADGDIQIEYKEASPLFVLIQWIDSGLDTCTDIATEMGVSKGFVSRLAKQALSLGRIRMNGRRYEVNE